MQRLNDVIAVVSIVAVSVAAPLALLYFEGPIALFIERM